MTLQEYYGFPKNVPVSIKQPNYFDTLDDDFPLPSSMFNAYKGNTRMSICKSLDTSNVTSMSHIFDGCTNLSIIPLLDTSKVTDMSYMFNDCSNLVTIPPLETSNVTNMSYMFNDCSNLVTIPPLETSNVTNMKNMFYYCSSLTSLPPMDCSKISSGSNYPLYNYNTYSSLTEVGGFLNMKYSWTDSYGLSKCPNLTYESCINILNGLYDFTGNGQTPTSSQGKLKVHANFLTKVGDDIEIATSRGWTVTT